MTSRLVRHARAMCKRAQGQSRPALVIDSATKEIIRYVAEKYGVFPDEIRRGGNQHRLSSPRHMAMYLCRELTSASLPRIGRCFGSRHHTTVMYAIRRVELARRLDPDVQSFLDIALSKLATNRKKMVASKLFVPVQFEEAHV